MNEQILERFKLYAAKHSIKVSLQSVEFDLVSLEQVVKFGQTSRVTGGVDIKATDFKDLPENEKSNYVPLVSGTLDNNQISGYINKSRVEESNLSEAPCLSWTRINASRFFYQKAPVCTNDDSATLTNIPKKSDLEYLLYAIPEAARIIGFDWTNKAGVGKVKELKIPIPKSYDDQHDSIIVQKILVDFIKYEQGKYDHKLKTLSDLYEKFDLLEKLIVPRTLEKSRAAMEKFERFLEREGKSFDLEELEFEKHPVQKMASFPSTSRVTGGVDIKPEEYNNLNDEEKELYTPLVSGTTTNNQVSGFIKNERLSENNYSPAPCLSWTRINASVFFKHETAVCINDDSFVLTEKENESTLDYLLYTIPLEASKQGFGWGNKAGISKIKDLKIAVPKDVESNTSIEIQEMLSSFFYKYILEIEGKRAGIRQLEDIIPQYQDAFVQALFTILKNQANGQ